MNVNELEKLGWGFSFAHRTLTGLFNDLAKIMAENLFGAMKAFAHS